MKSICTGVSIARRRSQKKTTLPFNTLIASARAGRELPLVAKDDSVYAIFGVEISDAVKVTEQTERIVYLACEK